MPEQTLTHTPHFGGIMSIEHSPERRHRPRIKEAFPTRVRGVDRNGQPFETETVLENLSATGLYLRTTNPVESGTNVSVTILFANIPDDKRSWTRMAADAVVLRSEPTKEGGYGLGMVITGYHFLHPDSNSH
jgi:PilZ domain-containing protein